jgi:hypothetical protein
MPAPRSFKLYPAAPLTLNRYLEATGYPFADGWTPKLLKMCTRRAIATPTEGLLGFVWWHHMINSAICSFHIALEHHSRGLLLDYAFLRTVTLAMGSQGFKHVLIDPPSPRFGHLLTRLGFSQAGPLYIIELEKAPWAKL